jgi:hypothetical protein
MVPALSRARASPTSRIKSVVSTVGDCRVLAAPGSDAASQPAGGSEVVQSAVPGGYAWSSKYGFDALMG